MKLIAMKLIVLGMLNWSKLHLKRFVTIQLLKNYREILRT